MIIFDLERRVTVDEETGEYMVVKPVSWYHDPCDGFTIRAMDGSPIFAADVQIERLRNVNDGPISHTRYIVRRAWFPSGKPERPTYFFGKTDMMERLAAFIRVWHDAEERQGEQSTFEFQDGRVD